MARGPASSSSSSSPSSSTATSSSWLRFFTLVLRILLWPLRPLLQLLFPPHELDGLSASVTAEAARKFSDLAGRFLPTVVGDSPWATEGYNECKQRAIRTQSLLCVYLHSPLHRDANKILQNLLSHEQVLTLLEQQPPMVNLGLSIHSSQGAQLAQMLHAAAYPLLVVLQPTRNNYNTPLLLRLEGPALVHSTPQTLATYLSSVMTKHRAHVAQQESIRIEREQARLLRQQQDEEYQQALLDDQQRQREQQEEQDRLEREAQQEQDRRDALQQAKQDLLSTSQTLLTTHAIVGNSSSSSTTRTRFVLPSGKKLEHKFRSDAPVSVLRAFLRVHFHQQGMEEIANIGLSTSFPRKTFNEESDEQLTLQEAGLCPQAVLMVQDLDA